MQEPSCVNLSNFEFEATPFPHFWSLSVLQPGLGNEVHQCFETTLQWSLTEADFYTQYEVVLSEENLPENLQCIVSADTVGTIRSAFERAFKVESLNLVSVVAHKLVNGHTIGIHNDYLNGEETHRLVIHINPSWNEANGGFLMLFYSPRAEDVSKVVQPLHNSGFGFQISHQSFHAVSTIHHFSRYSIVYTFKGR